MGLRLSCIVATFERKCAELEGSPSVFIAMGTSEEFCLSSMSGTIWAAESLSEQVALMCGERDQYEHIRSHFLTPP